jgi:hypothetical protein
MASERSAVLATAPEPAPALTTESVHVEGILGGLFAAATIAGWFFLVDLVHGRPLYTPTVLGTALFGGGARLEAPETLAVSGEMVFLFTWVHGLVFAILGGVVARMIALMERDPHLGFGILLLFVYLEGAFVVASFLFAETVLHALAWTEVLVGNLLAATAMVLYFRRRHPNLRVRP